MNNKRAEGRISPVLIAALVAIAVLILVVGSASLGLGETKDKFLTLIGVYNSSVSPAEGFDLLRYDILEDKVQYPTGKKWMDLGEKFVGISDKKVNHEIKHWFVDEYYYKKDVRPAPYSPLPYKFELEGGVNGKQNYLKEFAVESFEKDERGSTILRYSHFVREEDKNSLPLESSYIPGRLKVSLTGDVSILDNGNEFADLFLEEERKDVGVGSEGLIGGKPEYMEFLVFKNYLNGKTGNLSQQTLEHLNKINGTIIALTGIGLGLDSFNVLKAFEEDNIKNGFEFSSIKPYRLVRISNDNEEEKPVYRIFYDKEPLEIFIEFESKKLGNQYSRYQLVAKILAREVSEEEYKKIRDLTSVEQEIVSKVSVWRDSILEKPMRIEFEEDTKYFCVKKVRERYLVINLAESVSEGEKCA